MNFYNPNSGEVDTGPVTYRAKTCFLLTQLDRDPVLAIDYLRRAYLISGERGIQQKAQHIVEEENYAGRAKNSVELLLAGF